MRLGIEKNGPPALRVLNLGAGVQSSTVLELIAAEELSPAPDVALFADTGWEPKRVYEWLAFLENRSAVPIERVRAWQQTKWNKNTGGLRGDVLAAIGSERAGSVGQPPFFVKGQIAGRGMLWRKCTREYKIAPIRQKIREILGVAKGARVPAGTWVEQWYGISVDEAALRCVTPRDSWAVNYYPLVELGWSRQKCAEWMLGRTGRKPPRSACIGCPYHSDREWAEMKRERPEEFADAVAFDQAIRTGIPGVRGEAFLHSSCHPLGEVIFEDNAQGDLFAECEGVCGV